MNKCEAKYVVTAAAAEKQVLIKCDEDQILTNSYEVILEKAKNAMGQVSDLAPPAELEIMRIVKTCKNGFLINFNTKEAAHWL